jgi:hypothetical protein
VEKIFLTIILYIMRCIIEGKQQTVDGALPCFPPVIEKMSKSRRTLQRMTESKKWLSKKIFARKCVRLKFPLHTVRAAGMSFRVEIHYAKPVRIFIFIDWEFLT